MLPFVCCLCPTYKRPRLLANAIACFLAQDYPADRRQLIICDDAGQIAPQVGHGWIVLSQRQRFPSLPEKYNWLAGWSQKEILAVWEDDDIYLPWHLSANVQAMQEQSRGWSHNRDAWSLYNGKLVSEPAHGRFHASLVISRELLKRIGGWPETDRLDFDQQFIGRLNASEPPAVPEKSGYVFRWASTKAYHAQSYGEHWYDAIGKLNLPDDLVDVLRPEFDDETQQIYGTVAGGFFASSADRCTS